MLTFVHGQLVLLIEYHKSRGRDLFLRDISSSHSRYSGFHCTFVCLSLELCIEISKMYRRKSLFRILNVGFWPLAHRFLEIEKE